MQIQVKWLDGAFHPVHPLNLKHQIVMINVPDEEIEEILIHAEMNSNDQASASTEAKQLINRFKQILGPYYIQRAGSTVEQDKELLIEALEEKYSQ